MNVLHLSLFVTISCALHCPRNVPYFSTVQCIPNPSLSQARCPSGYRCRPAREEFSATDLYFICCDSSDMQVADYFLEAQLSPEYVPQIPFTLLRSIVLLDQKSGQRVIVEEFDGEVSGVDRVPNDTASYDRLDFVQFEREIDPNAGRFLHFLLARGVVTRPTQIQMYYDYPNFGQEWSNITELDQRLRRGFIEYTTNETVPKQAFYRDMFVVLSFRTEQPLGASRDAETQLDKVLETTNGDLSRLLSHEHFGSRLGAPIGGYFFHLTSRGTVFKSLQDDNDINFAFNAQLNTFVAMMVLLLLLM
ncbi:unnamed protein product [Bursaphelenchus okinawaensis]|uniref:Uncharacterized protein n=1 Tax=Bursaphelenchus okinawaensis TaxID=465554 RepID=A0A811KBD9_9BILA|nr:unnamed protein product [Bursaphelenchus okinawaensis]CAG9097035.1 unnamed protein product [Bursaphelenchus okinawaensis]